MARVVNYPGIAIEYEQSPTAESKEGGLVLEYVKITWEA